jgi:hypothetical protein
VCRAVTPVCVLDAADSIKCVFVEVKSEYFEAKLLPKQS